MIVKMPIPEESREFEKQLKLLEKKDAAVVFEVAGFGDGEQYVITYHGSKYLPPVVAEHVMMAIQDSKQRAPGAGQKALL